MKPLENDQYFGANFQKALQFPEMISRNRILHGEEINYSNEVNSYKVISLLSYVAIIIYDAMKRELNKFIKKEIDTLIDEYKKKFLFYPDSNFLLARLSSLLFTRKKNPVFTP